MFPPHDGPYVRVGVLFRAQIFGAPPQLVHTTPGDYLNPLGRGSVALAPTLAAGVSRECVSHTTASSSLRAVQYPCLLPSSDLLAYVMTRSSPSCTWDNTAPVPMSLASVSRYHGPSSWGNPNIGVLVKVAFSSLKALSLRFVHSKFVPLVASSYSGAAGSVKPRMCIL